jgi:dibenzofuran dioxygenase subunit beta
MENPVALRELQHEIEQFLYHEAWLLDEWRFDEWLELFTDDLVYFMPSRELIANRAQTAKEEEPALTLFRDRKDFLVKRVRRLQTELAHSEMPSSRTRRLITNVMLNEDEDGVRVHCNFVIFQSRTDSLQHSGNTFFGKRVDRLRKVNGQWKFTRRKIELDHVLLPQTLSIFF